MMDQHLTLHCPLELNNFLHGVAAALLECCKVACMMQMVNFDCTARPWHHTDIMDTGQIMCAVAYPTPCKTNMHLNTVI